MGIGAQIRSARIEKGLSQRQLCQDVVTRNMLSQIENGTANPSLPTLEILAERLQKPLSYFFGESGVSPERALADSAWNAYAQGDFSEAAEILERTSDKRLELNLLSALVLLALAQKAIQEGRHPYARQLLTQVQAQDCPIPELRRRALLLQGQLTEEPAAPLCASLPSLDAELILRAQGAMEAQNPLRAAQLLDAAENQTSPRWAFLRGTVYFAQANYTMAAQCFHKAENTYPAATAPYLENCYKELEDYRQAYFYACRQKEKK